MQNGLGDSSPSAPDYYISPDGGGLTRERFWFDRDTGGFCYAQTGEKSGKGWWGEGPNCPGHLLVSQHLRALPLYRLLRLIYAGQPLDLNYMAVVS